MDQIWTPVFYLEIETLKFSIAFEINKIETLLKEIKRLSLIDAKVTVLIKSFF